MPTGDYHVHVQQIALKVRIGKLRMRHLLRLSVSDMESTLPVRIVQLVNCVTSRKFSRLRQHHDSDGFRPISLRKRCCNRSNSPSSSTR